jgi:hypothetical protein
MVLYRLNTSASGSRKFTVAVCLPRARKLKGLDSATGSKPYLMGQLDQLRRHLRDNLVQYRCLRQTQGPLPLRTLLRRGPHPGALIRQNKLLNYYMRYFPLLRSLILIPKKSKRTHPHYKKSYKDRCDNRCEDDFRVSQHSYNGRSSVLIHSHMMAGGETSRLRTGSIHPGVAARSGMGCSHFLGAENSDATPVESLTSIRNCKRPTGLEFRALISGVSST